MTRLTNKINRLKQNNFRVSIKHYRFDEVQYNRLRSIKDRLDARNTRSLDILNNILDIQPEPAKDMRKNKVRMSPRGGRTVVTLEKDGKVAVGVSECLFADNFCYSYGSAEAIERAVENFAGNILV